MAVSRMFLRIFVATGLVLLGVGFLTSKGLFRAATGFTALVAPVDVPLSNPEQSTSVEAFLRQRDVLEFEVDRVMTVEEMLDRYRIDFPHVRRQLERQLNVPHLADGDSLPKGRHFRILLTPVDTVVR
jgi:hypothetical protein